MTDNEFKKFIQNTIKHIKIYMFETSNQVKYKNKNFKCSIEFKSDVTKSEVDLRNYFDGTDSNLNNAIDEFVKFIEQHCYNHTVGVITLLDLKLPVAGDNNTYGPYVCSFTDGSGLMLCIKQI